MSQPVIGQFGPVLPKNQESVKALNGLQGAGPGQSLKSASQPSANVSPSLPSRPGHKPSENLSESQIVSLSQDTLKEAVKSSLAQAPVPSEAAIEAHQAREAAREGLEGPARGVQKGTKRGSYKTKGATESRLASTSSADNKSAESEKFRKVGREIADTLIIAGRTLGGEDWNTNIVKDEKTGEILHDERKNLQDAWADMAEEYQWGQFPAWLGCTLATSAYILPRLNAPSTITRMQKLKVWWAARKIRKQDEAQAKASEANADKKG